MYKLIVYSALFFLLTDISSSTAPFLVRSIKKRVRTLPAYISVKEPVSVPVDDESTTQNRVKIIDDKTGDRVSGSFVKKLPSVANFGGQNDEYKGVENPEASEENGMMKELRMMEESGAMEESKGEERILGGMTALPGMFPYMASLRSSDMYHICGAAILNKYWLITAAHCGNEYTYVVVGSNSLWSDGQTYNVNRIKFYGFNSTTFANDIALVRVSKPIQFSVGTVEWIPLIDYDLSDGTTMVFSGWGYINNGGPPSNNLQYIYVKQMNIYACANIMSDNPKALPVYYSEVCASSKPDQGACRGDSGGPLVYNWQLVGIDSWGPKPCGTYPDVFTKVKWYSNWIYNTISS